jgi:hypothetical protein
MFGEGGHTYLLSVYEEMDVIHVTEKYDCCFNLSKDQHINSFLITMTTNL